jgi:hypothetical protein
VKALRTILKPHALLAIVLMFWCAGTGCMIVGYARAAAANSDPIVEQMSHSIGSMAMDAHACCKAKRPGKTVRARSDADAAPSDFNLLTTPSAPSQTSVMDCCPLTSGSIVVSSRSQSNDNATAAQQLNSASFSFVGAAPPPPVVPLHLPSRAHSYLLDCAFLI